MRYQEEIRFHKQEDGVYYISVAARILNVHPQTLRMYEKMGLIQPKRTGDSEHSPRLYSQRDIERIRRIQYLTDDLGVSLKGVQLIFDLLGEMERLRQEMETEMQQLNRLYSQMLAEHEAHPLPIERRHPERQPEVVRIIPIVDGDENNGG